MSRFITPDLASLGKLPLVPVDFERTEQARTSFLVKSLKAFGLDYDVGTLETDPLRIAYSEGGAYVESLIDQRINESITALSLATAAGPALDHIAATYYGLARQTRIGEKGETITEDDARFRARIALAPEAFSTAGPEGAYLFHALELDGIQDLADAAAYSEEDGATYSETLHTDAYSAGVRTTPFPGRREGDPVLAPEILTVVLPTSEFGPATQNLLDRCWHALSRKEVRPLGDCVRVEAAEIVPYQVEIAVTYQRGADPEPLILEAEKRIEAYTRLRRKVGFKSEILGIGGAAYVSGVEAVSLLSPKGDVGGGSKQAPECESIQVRAVQSEGSWQ